MSIGNGDVGLALLPRGNSGYGIIRLLDRIDYAIIMDSNSRIRPGDRILR